MHIVKCVNTDCPNHDIEIQCPPIQQLGNGVGVRIDPVCLACMNPLWRMPSRPVHVMMTIDEADAVLALIAPTDGAEVDVELLGHLHERLTEARENV